MGLRGKSGRKVLLAFSLYLHESLDLIQRKCVTSVTTRIKLRKYIACNRVTRKNILMKKENKENYDEGSGEETTQHP